jgi:hypothetical protein
MMDGNWWMRYTFHRITSLLGVFLPVFFVRRRDETLDGLPAPTGGPFSFLPIVSPHEPLPPHLVPLSVTRR